LIVDNENTGHWCTRIGLKPAYIELPDHGQAPRSAICTRA
jgi:hypothetical protein